MDGKAYHEKLSSARTEALFILLSLIFFALFAWCLSNFGWSGWTIAFQCVSLFFLFYVFNYRTLKIHLTPENLQLAFGIFTWKIAIANVESCYLDKPSIGSVGGAGIHFTWIKGKYRAFFNFLEHPRVVVVFKKKKGPVQEVAFSTRQPEIVLDLIQRYSA
jgi:hypothetical protein